MNILLDAYCDNNFGDDLFITILTERYPMHRFFAFIGGCTETVQRWANHLPNLVILPRCETVLQAGFFDAYIMIGGDVIPDGGDYTGGYERRIGFMRAVKQTGGWVGMLGFNLYERYSPKTYLDICEMLRLADDIVPRDKMTYDYLRSIYNVSAKIRQGVDIAFGVRLMPDAIQTDDKLLGISVRKKLGETEEVYKHYTENVAAVADAWLKRGTEYRVNFLALSYGSTNDIDAAKDVICNMQNQQRPDIVAYAGQINPFIAEFQRCRAVIATRFHSLVIALLLNKPVAAIPYEVKLNHLLDDLDFQGERFAYNAQHVDAEKIINSLESPMYSQQTVQNSVHQAEVLFAGFEQWAKESQNLPKQKNFDIALPVQCPYKQKLQVEQSKANVKYAECVQNYEMEIQSLHNSLAEQIEALNQYHQQEIAKVQQAYESQLAEMKVQNKHWINHAKNVELIANQMNDRLAQIRQIAASTIDTGNKLSGIRSFKAVHFISRLRNQYRYGTKEEKKAFRQWLRAHMFGHSTDFDTTYNPLYQLITPMQRIQQLSSDISGQFAFQGKIKGTGETVAQQERLSYDAPFLHERYDRYDVVIFSVIDYDFRYQRPQQIADHFARQGHRVFYINANFKQDKGIRVDQQGNLFKVTLYNAANQAVYSLNQPEACNEIYRQLEELMMEQGIRDALMIADYPTWISGIRRLKKQYGFVLMTDYMDDFTGFLSTCEPFVKEDCVELLRLSDAVVASSKFLEDVAKQYNEHVTVIRNGTEYEHFHQIHGQSTPKKRKVIGYYGAIAEWFDFGKIEYIARNFPECDVVLVGNITNQQVQQCELHNVKKLGEVPYKELPAYLKEFDVCLIPFDTSTDLIKATNPVKFYEYLSAGKKIVATEIPELEPYKDQYVYLANDNELFADYVRKCLEGTDTLAKPDACCKFAKQNDWFYRVGAFEKVAVGLFPKVSIVVLCYNQLHYTKQCLESILTQTAYPNYEVIAVDNCSTDDTASYLSQLAEKNERVKAVINTTNRGFAGGNNDGIDASDGQYIVLLNNDTLVTRGWLTAMVKHCESSERVGIVGSVTNSIGNEAQVQVEYQNVADMPAFAYGYTAKHMNETYPHDGVLAMFCVMFPRKLVDEIGKLDENYGIGMFEDDDYSIAAERAGFSLILPEDVFIHHFGSVSFKKLEDETHRKLFERNKAYFEQKWGIERRSHHYRS